MTERQDAIDKTLELREVIGDNGHVTFVKFDAPDPPEIMIVIRLTLEEAELLRFRLAETDVPSKTK